MLGRLLLLFTLVPLVELALLIRIGGWIGAGPTVLLVVLTGVAGAWLARREGVRTWADVRQQLRRGRVPGRELLHALMVVVSGAFLVTPGVLTDAAGLLLLLRPVRDRVIDRIRDWLARSLQEGRVQVWFGSTGPGGPEGRGRESPAGREPGPDGDRDGYDDGSRVIEL